MAGPAPGRDGGASRSSRAAHLGTAGVRRAHRRHSLHLPLESWTREKGPGRQTGTRRHRRLVSPGGDAGERANAGRRRVRECAGVRQEPRWRITGVPFAATRLPRHGRGLAAQRRLGRTRRPSTLAAGRHTRQAVHASGSTRTLLHAGFRLPRPTGLGTRPCRCRTHHTDHRRSAGPQCPAPCRRPRFRFHGNRRDELRLPTIPKSYHKINTGRFVQTPFGLRLLRQAEMERLHGHTLLTRHYATAVQMLGQGVQTRVFRAVFRQLADHLGTAMPVSAPV